LYCGTGRKSTEICATDKRADIWSFGVMLLEMLTGQRLLDGETISHTLADVLRANIDFGKLPHETPPVIRELLRRCLDRDTRSRLRDIGEARVAIQRYLANPANAGATSVGPSQAGRALWLTAAAWGVAAVGSRSRRRGRMADRSCGCGRSTHSSRGRCRAPKASSPARSGHQTAGFSRSA
jgi:hypothetical protein